MTLSSTQLLWTVVRDCGSGALCQSYYAAAGKSADVRVSGPAPRVSTPHLTTVNKGAILDYRPAPGRDTTS